MVLQREKVILYSRRVPKDPRRPFSSLDWGGRKLPALVEVGVFTLTMTNYSITARVAFTPRPRPQKSLIVIQFPVHHGRESTPSVRDMKTDKIFTKFRLRLCFAHMNITEIQQFWHLRSQHHHFHHRAWPFSDSSLQNREPRTTSAHRQDLMDSPSQGYVTKLSPSIRPRNLIIHNGKRGIKKQTHSEQGNDRLSQALSPKYAFPVLTSAIGLDTRTSFSDRILTFLVASVSGHDPFLAQGSLSPTPLYWPW